MNRNIQRSRYASAALAQAPADFDSSKTRNKSHIHQGVTPWLL